MTSTAIQKLQCRKPVCHVTFAVCILAAILHISIDTPASLWSLFRNMSCLAGSGYRMKEILRDSKSSPCGYCENVTAVPEVEGLSSEEFTRSYGYSGVPVLVKGAASNWRALHTFSFDYFQSLYLNDIEALEVLNTQCQFFPYNTEFTSLDQALRMPVERIAMKEGERPWYIGWSNCDAQVAAMIREHYQRPQFLPPNVESDHIDWVFIGSPGHGAGMHIDKVDLPSWQAQISGTKTWSLSPSDECCSVCHDLQVTVHTGDILVLDTNLWYHATFIHKGSISISIGSEYE